MGGKPFFFFCVFFTKRQPGFSSTSQAQYTTLSTPSCITVYKQGCIFICTGTTFKAGQLYVWQLDGRAVHSSTIGRDWVSRAYTFKQKLKVEGGQLVWGALISHWLRLHAVNIQVKVNSPVSETFRITRLQTCVSKPGYSCIHSNCNQLGYSDPNCDARTSGRTENIMNFRFFFLYLKTRTCAEHKWMLRSIGISW